jgi:hypothetical protein
MTANLLTLRKEKREQQMKRHLLPATAMVTVLVLFLFVPRVAFSQQLQSGALLTITSSDGSVNRAVYDSQIHSNTVQVSPCDGAIVTDAYIVQGGSPTGCDEGDNYEVTAANNPSPHQSQASATISGTGYSFTVTTFYLCGYGQDSDNACTYPTPLSVPPTFTPPINGYPNGPFCNTNNSICTNPDTGFLAVTNNSATAFSGTITLAGTSPTQGGQFCPPNGIALDTINSTLPAGNTWIFALSFDSSNCGGFTQSQTHMLAAGATIKFPFGPDEAGNPPLPGDDYILAGTNNTGGEQIKFDLFPTLQSLSNPGGTAANSFNPGPNFPLFTCDPYGSLSNAIGATPNYICAEVHLDCSVGGVENGGDCTTFYYNLTQDYTVPSTYGGAGSALLADTGVFPSTGSCPSDSYNQNIFASVTVDQVKKKGSDNPASACFVAANGVLNGQPAPLVTQGETVVSFEGLEFPFTLLPPKLNYIIPGLIAPLSFDYVGTNLNSSTFSPTSFPINCSTGAPLGPPVPISGHLYNLTQLFPKLFPPEHGLTEYLFNWQTVKGSKGCASIAFTFANGPTIVVPQEFSYIH